MRSVGRWRPGSRSPWRRDCPETIASGFAAEPAVVDAVHLTGADDHELTLRCRDTDELDEVLVRLKRERGVVRSQTRIVLSRSVRREPRPAAPARGGHGTGRG